MAASMPDIPMASCSARARQGLRRLVLACALGGVLGAQSGGALALPPTPLDDTQLAQVSARDGINFALHLELNQVPGGDSRLTLGQKVDGRTTYTVLKNPSGIIDMFALGISAATAPDGTNYMAVTLPSVLSFTNFGFESLSVQADPLGPVTDSLGRFTLNGTMSMQGQLRLWAH